MDDMDRKILRILQDDSSRSVADIAREVGLSASPCWKRISRLQSDGVIRRQVTVLDPDMCGFGLTVFVSIKTGEHSSEWLQRFAKNVETMPEVLEFHRMAGEIDYLLKVVVPDVKSFDLFYKRLIDLTPLGDVTSRFSMETIKDTTSLPL
ncbi:MAG: Lrp/AsnC family transcriptional regulator [Rhodospirillaceae bacterium]|jgi:Lrp/AsnC family transcriptional regulator|nr:Lrp/AsnC family transcriptional regulator [Rhodospirillaceae bacterium]MBT6136580.1 Lrp/AsnC family transcriptional regulator [Rhodospirillaceae bacterium]